MNRLLMPLSADWNGRSDPFGGAAYGMQIENSHAAVQGIRMLGMPVLERPKAVVIHRLYAIGRIDRSLDDLEVKQCLFAGDEVTNPHHLSLLVNGSGLVVEHCVFYRVKQSIVYWTPGTRGHAMRNCLAYGCRAGVWTSGIANDFDYRNNVVANGEYVWIGQGARSAPEELQQLAGRGGGGAAPGGPPPGGRTRGATRRSHPAGRAICSQRKPVRRESNVHRLRCRTGAELPRQRSVDSGARRHQTHRPADRTGDGRVEEELSAPNCGIGSGQGRRRALPETVRWRQKHERISL